MDAATQRRCLFVAGQPLEYWEDSDIAFGWTREDIQAYADRGEWVLLFNAIFLIVPSPGIEHGS